MYRVMWQRETMPILFQSRKNEASRRENPGHGSSEHKAIDPNEFNRKGATADVSLRVDLETRMVQSLGVRVLQEYSERTAAVVE